MSNELCFNIENNNLYLEQVLVDYTEIPIFFLCKDEKQYYIALCTDIEELRYIVTKLSLPDVYNLLHGKIPMRDVILKQNEYWDIISGDEICFDNVIKKSICELDKNLLPEEYAYFEILTEQIKLFVQKFDCEFFNPEYFFTSNKEADLSESFTNLELNALLENIDQVQELVDYIDYNVKNMLSSKVKSYNEKMKLIINKEITVTFSTSLQSKHLETDNLFKLIQSSVNNISVAA